MQQLGVKVDPSGQFTTDFVPDEIGEWTVCIQSNGQDISGSPFHVRVYDPGEVKVHGIQGGSMGQPVNFAVDAQCAGDGSLTVDVFYRNRCVPAHINRQGSSYSVHFDPVGPGTYKIHVCYASQEVAGSPFTVEIVNSASVMLSGEGLSCARANTRASFLINMGDNKGMSADLSVRITSPRGRQVQTRVVPVGGGCSDFRVEFTPTEVGDHIIEVCYYGQPVQGTPYRCQVYDWNSITVSNMPSLSVLGRLVSFDIDAVDSGNGRLEILVNDGRIPCKVEKQSGRRYTASFAPSECGVYTIEMKFNGHTLNGSPWKVNVINADHVRIEGAHRNCVHVNTETGFDVLTSPYDGQVCVGVRSPSGRSIPVNIKQIGKEIHRVDFVPTEIGPHDVIVTYEGLPVLGSPFQIMACNPNAILVTSVCWVLLGNPVEFNVDASKAGPGDLEIQVNRGTVPSKADLLSPSNYAVTFIPTAAGKYVTDIQFNGQTLPQSPMITHVIDISKVLIHGGSSASARVGKTHTIRVDAHSAGEAQLCATVMSPSCDILPTSVTEIKPGCYEVTFTPKEPGPHRVDIDYAGVHVPCSPVLIMAYDVSRIRVLGVVDGLVGKKSSFSVGLNDCGEGELEVVIMSCHGRPILNQVTALEPGRLEVTYVPQEGGVHFAEVTFNKEHVIGSPFQFNVYDACRASARGDGLSLVQCNQTASFVITAPEAKLCDLDVKILSPSGRDVLPNICEMANGNFKVDYVPTQTGIYQIEVTYFGVPIPCSPFQVKAWDAGKVLITNLCRSHVGCESFFNIELGDAGDGTVEISITDPNGQLIQNQVVTKGPGLLEVHYVPQVMGEHRVNVIFNGVKVPGCPMPFMVLDSSKVTARGDGLGLVQVNCPATFMVCAPEGTKLKDLDIKVIGPGGNELLTNITETSSGNFRVEYTPTCVGTYQIPISYCCNPIMGSPFAAHAWDANRVLVADVGMGQVGCPSSFKVIVADAGEGVVEISITDPNGQLVANQAGPCEPGVVQVNYVPQVVGIHKGCILFNKQKIPGSPFSFLVIDSCKVTVQGQALGLVPVKKQTSFTLTAPCAQRKDIDVRVIGPNGQDLATNITEIGQGMFRVDYTPLMAGDQAIEVMYFGRPVCGNWKTKAWDVCRVQCSPIPMGRVGHASGFTVDMRESGEGKLEISIVGPNGQNIENVVSAVNRTPGVFQVSCVPSVAGCHRAMITFNDEQCLNSPISFMVIDPCSASASGEGLQSVRCGTSTTFMITAPAATVQDLCVRITGPRGKDIPFRIQEKQFCTFSVDYTPQCPGEHLIEVRYFDIPIKDSPFTVIAWDANLVHVSNIKCGIVGKPTTFNVNACEAGPGNVEISITSRGESVRNVARRIDKAGLIECSYTPICTDPHIINVRFNGEPVNGSPFVANVLDGSLATAQGPGLGKVMANCVTSFDVMSRQVGCDADVQVLITSPCGQNVPAYITGSSNSNFHVEYSPVEAGRHTINVLCAGMEIKGSPFYPEVFDPCQVRIHRNQCGVVGKPVHFKVDTTMAGAGRVTVDVRGERTNPCAEIIPSSSGIHLVSFIPTEGCVHMIIVKFNDCDVPGCPYPCFVIDQKSLQVRWDAVRLTPVHKPAVVELDSTNSPEAPVVCCVTDPFGKPLATQQRRVGTVHGFMFMPVEVGPHIIDLRYGCDAVPGSPFTCNAYDVSKVRIIEATSCGNIGQEVGFTVDASQAGMGTLETTVTCGGANVPVRCQQLGPDRLQYFFVAKSPIDHIIKVTFNGDMVPGAPLVWRIVNPASKMCLSNATACKSVAIGQIVAGIVQHPGYPINPNDITAKVACPSGDIVPTRITQQPDGSIRIEYTSMYIGTHLLKAEYAGQTIPGSPLVMEVFDPNKIQIEGARVGEVNSPMAVDINYAHAGLADICVSVIDPSGNPIPFNSERTSSGMRITYTPEQPGSHKIQVTYGGMDVPGCPVRQEIRAVIPVTACGDGLIKGIVNQVASFYVDPKGQKGELLAQVQGPTSLARIQIEPEQGGRLKVNYLPMEVGMYTINLQFNCVPVDGCPFFPRVVDPSMVEVIDDFSKWSGPDRLCVPVNEMKCIRFDTGCAGPGQLTATIEGPDGKLCPDVLPIGMDGYALKFVPRKEGDYYIRVYWNDLPISRFPIIATAGESCGVCPSQKCDSKKLVVTGPGLMSARVMEPAQFMIDGSRAGNGAPGVRIVGVTEDIECLIEQIGMDQFACTYIPKKTGAYLITVTWCGQQSPDSPYKVTVMSSSDASKVICTGDGLTCGVLGQNLSVLVDARRAGPGELVARCEGPSRQAFCDIDNRRDGTYEVSVRPQECGMHQLYITYDGQAVIGSPFYVKIVAAPDASKVTVCGEGIKNGILATFESDFTVNTCGAGPGQLTVKVRAKKGAFRVEMQRSKDSDRVIHCRYHPTEIGEYFIHVQWSGQHVPNSPFRVVIVDTIDELRRLTGDGGGMMVNDVVYGGGSGSEFGTISNLGGGGEFQFDDC